MDVSIIAAIGSFVVSERVIKAKATVLIGLLCTVSYDLFIHSNDPVSLRVYRGPACIAITLIACAFCLRAWRRNGIACDELLFLPGSIHAEASNKQHDSNNLRLPLNLRHSNNPSFHSPVTSLMPTRSNSPPNMLNATSDVEMDTGTGIGIGIGTTSKQRDTSQLSARSPVKSTTNVDSNIITNTTTITTTTTAKDDIITKSSSQTSPETNIIHERDKGVGAGISASSAASSVTNLYNAFQNAAQEHNDVEYTYNDSAEMEMVPLAESVAATSTAAVTITNQQDEELSNNVVWWRSVCRGRNKYKRASTSPPPPSLNRSPSDEHNTTVANANGTTTARNRTSKGVSEQLKGIARFFSSSQESNEYAPSGPIVASAGLDLCLPVLFNFHLFMLATNSKSGSGAGGATVAETDSGDETNLDDSTAHLSSNDNYSIPPQVLPLIFLSILSARAFIPLKARSRFWGTVHSAVSSPFYHVTFRDAFLCEVATSLVRPLQDICFAIFYYFASMYGIFTGKIGLEDTGSRLTHNLLLHNVVLPTCAVIPLLCRFLQTLRRAYDEQRRWPHLGNAFKYLSASLVVSYGMTHSEEIRSHWWILSFVMCTLYQAWWDIVMDWELITISHKNDISANGSGVCIPFVGRIQLRSKRLFKSNRSYWRIIILNTLFRFTWMLSFIPAYHLSTSTGEIKGTFSSDIKSVVGFVVVLAELIRRSAWSILRLELETIKLTDDEYVSAISYSLPSARIQYSWFAPKESSNVRYDPIDMQLLSPSVQRIEMNRAAYRLLVKKIYVVELILWVVAFIGLGILVSVFL